MCRPEWCSPTTGVAVDGVVHRFLDMLTGSYPVAACSRSSTHIKTPRVSWCPRMYVFLFALQSDSCRTPWTVSVLQYCWNRHHHGHGTPAATSTRQTLSFRHRLSCATSSFITTCGREAEA